MEAGAGTGGGTGRKEGEVYNEDKLSPEAAGDLPTAKQKVQVSLAGPRNFAGQHLQVVDLLAEFGLGDAVEKLADARVRALFQFFRGAIRDDMAFVQQHHAIGDQEGAGQFVSDHDDGDSEGFF